MKPKALELTELLNAAPSDNSKDAAELLKLVYDELRHLAAAKLAREKPGQTLQPTALVHEAWLRLTGEDADKAEWSHRGHFFLAAGEAMRRILVENARRKSRIKHGANWNRVSMDAVDLAAELPDERLLDLHDALTCLEDHDPQGAQLINLRFFVGMPQAQAALVLGISERTAKRVFAYARAWLMNKLREQG